MADRIRIGDATYGRPVLDERDRPTVDVAYDDGERFVTYAVTEDVLNAWAEVDTFGRQLTEEDIMDDNICEAYNTVRKGMCKAQLTPQGDCPKVLEHGDHLADR